MRFEGQEFYLKTAAEMERRFPDQREALLNTRRIAEMVDLKLPLGDLRIPHFPVPDGETVGDVAAQGVRGGPRPRATAPSRRSSSSAWTTSWA